MDVTSYGTSEWRRFDNFVDETLMETLNRKCEMESQMYARMVQDAQGWFSVDAEKMARARSMGRPNCERLQGVRNRLQGWL